MKYALNLIHFSERKNPLDIPATFKERMVIEQESIWGAIGYVDRIMKDLFSPEGFILGNISLTDVEGGFPFYVWYEKDIMERLSEKDQIPLILIPIGNSNE